MAANIEWLVKVLSVAPTAFVGNNILSAGASLSVASNTLAEQFQKSKKLKLNVSKCMVLQC